MAVPAVDGYKCFASNISGIEPMGRFCKLVAEIIQACAMHIFTEMSVQGNNLFKFCKTVGKATDLADFFKKTDYLRTADGWKNTVSLCCISFIRFVNWISFLKEMGVSQLGVVASLLANTPVLGTIGTVGAVINIVDLREKIEVLEIRKSTTPDDWKKQEISNNITKEKFNIVADVARIILNTLQVGAAVGLAGVVSLASCTPLMTAALLTSAACNLAKVVAGRYFDALNQEIKKAAPVV